MRREPPAYANQIAEAERFMRLRRRLAEERIYCLTPAELRSKAKKARRRKTKRTRRALAQSPISRPRMGATKQRKVANRKRSVR
jgi:hypothetical protein